MATPPDAARRGSWRSAAGGRPLAWGLIALGIGLRLAWVLSVDPVPIKDSAWYFSHAEDIAAGRGYQEYGDPTAYWPVGYPAFLGLAFHLFGPGLMVARLCNIALAGASLACILIIARRVTGSPIAANLAVLLFALYPADISYSSLVMSEPLFNALTLGGVACLVALPWPAARVAGAGVAFGLAALVRAHGLILPAVAGIAVLPLAGGAWKRSFATIAATYLVLAATLAPWCLRNLMALDAFVPVSTNGGVNLFIGNNPHATGGYRFDEPVRAPLRAATSSRWRGGRGEVELDRVAGAMARRYMIEHPGATLAGWPAKLAELYGGEWAVYHWNQLPDRGQHRHLRTLRRLGVWLYPMLWVCALLGLAAAHLGRTRHLAIRAPLLAAALAVALARLSWIDVPLAALLGWLAARRGPPPRLSLPWLAPALIAGFTLVHVVYFGAARYHHLMMPWAAILAGWFLALPFGPDETGMPSGRRQDELRPAGA